MWPSSEEYRDLAKKTHTDDLQLEILKLRDRVKAIQRNQDYAKVSWLHSYVGAFLVLVTLPFSRYRYTHQAKSLLFQSRIESNNTKAMWVSVVQIVILLATGFFQAQHLRKYFHKKKLV
jgi:hypothetical protein